MSARVDARASARANAATIRDVAREAGVSTATVSRTLSGGGRVSRETAARVRAVVARLGYAVNHAARSLKTRSTRTIGVIAPDLATDFFMLLAERLEGELAARGWSLLICSSRESVAEEKRRLGLFAERLVDGVVAIPASSGAAHFREAVAAGMPLVLVDRAPRGAGADAVLVDNEGGARAAVLALAALGHRRIGLIGGDPAVSTAREREAGYLSAMRELDLPVEPAFVRHGPLHIESGHRLMGEMLALPDPPDAYFVVNADTHIGATNWLMTAGRAFRDRVAFAAFDEMPYSPLLQFCRISVEQPVAEMGQAAARMVLERIDGEGGARPRTLRLPTRLIRH